MGVCVWGGVGIGRGGGFVRSFMGRRICHNDHGNDNISQIHHTLKFMTATLDLNISYGFYPGRNRLLKWRFIH